jgi:hypothetical protein
MSVVFSLINLASPAARACAVCFGGKDQPGLVRGLIIGGVILLASVFSILIALTKAVWDMERRKSAIDSTGLGIGRP